MVAADGNLAAGSAFLPRTGRKFRFRAGLTAWQSRNAGPIFEVSLVRKPQITVLSRISDGHLISEFLIVGCDHGWLGRMGYDHGEFEWTAIRAASRA